MGARRRDDQKTGGPQARVVTDPKVVGYMLKAAFADNLLRQLKALVAEAEAAMRRVGLDRRPRRGAKR